MNKKEGQPRDIAVNRRAFHEYVIGERYEAGLSLLGSEVKSLRAGKVELVDAFAAVERGELWLKQMYIAPFEMASAFPHDPRRARKVLVHASEIARIDRAVAREGMTLVPLRLYFKRGRVKVGRSLGAAGSLAGGAGLGAVAGCLGAAGCLGGLCRLYRLLRLGDARLRG